MTTEIEPVRSNSPELAAMTLPKLKTVATQLLHHQIMIVEAVIDSIAMIVKVAIATVIATVIVDHEKNVNLF